MKPRLLSPIELCAPTLLFAPVALVFAATDLDRTIAQAWAFDAGRQQFIARGSFWANQLLHAGGRDAVILLTALALAAVVIGSIAPRRFPLFAAYRHELLVGITGSLAIVAVVGLLKHSTNVDCPWNLAGFGGTHPYLGVFGHRASQLPPSACFPGAHSATGFSLLAYFFAFRRSAPRFAKATLVAALSAGLLFAFAQEARGAHFLSHDLWSAYLAWIIGLSTGWLAGPARVTAGCNGTAGPVPAGNCHW